MKKRLLQFVHMALAMTVIFGGYGNVLCHGSDGHIAIEPILHSHCHHDGGHCHNTDTGRGDDAEIHITDVCSPCVDVSITTDIEPVRSVKIVLNHTPARCVSLTDELKLQGFRLYAEHLTYCPFFSPLETIVLLT